MKDMKNTTPFIENDWPYKISFDEINNMQIECCAAKVLYKIFLSLIRLPELLTHSFLDVLIYDVEQELMNNKKIVAAEKYFFKIFDEMYALNDLDVRPNVFTTPN